MPHSTHLPEAMGTATITPEGRFEAGGLGRRISVFRLPEENLHREVRLERRIPLVGGERDDAVYVRVVFEDGHVAWTSPIYVFR